MVTQVSLSFAKVRLNLGFFPSAQCTVSYVLPDVLIHAFPAILAFYSFMFWCFSHLIDAWRCPYRMGLFSVSVVGLVICLWLVVFGMASGVSVILIRSGVTVSVLGCGVRSSIMLCCAVLLLVWNAGSILLGGSEHWDCGMPLRW